MRGLKLAELSGDDIRPTTDRVKENIFNLIAGCIAHAEVLDLFAGTGALGIEAVSRGAAHAVFCDRSEASLAVARTNVARARLENSVELVHDDALSYLKHCSRQFDLIFLDPPYQSGLLDNVAALLWEYGIVKEGGIVVAEHDVSCEVHAPFEVWKDRQYGRTQITVYRA